MEEGGGVWQRKYRCNYNDALNNVDMYCDGGVLRVARNIQRSAVVVVDMRCEYICVSPLTSTLVAINVPM
jgi:hypothetical protein